MMRSRINFQFWFPTTIFFFIGLCLVVLRAMHFDLSFVPGDLGDARLNNYFLEHGYKWLTGQVPDFWNAPFFYPASAVMTYSDNFLGTLPIYSFFRLLNFDREMSFQLWFVAVFTLNYFCCAWVLKKLSIHAVGCIVGAYVFSFSLPVIAKMSHCQLLARFMIPLAFYFTLKYLEKPAAKPLALACLATVIQVYCTIYMGVFLVLGLLAMLAAFYLVPVRRPALYALMGKDRRSVWVNVSIVIFSLACLLPLMVPYRQTSLEFGTRSWGEIMTMLPRVVSYFYPADGSFLWHRLTGIGKALPMAHEHKMFAGALPLLGLTLMPLIYLRYRMNPLIKAGMIFAVVTFILVMLTLSIGDYSAYRLVTVLPGLSAVRGVTRIILLMVFPLAVVLAVVVHVLLEGNGMKFNPQFKTTLTCIILLLLVFDQHMTAGGFYAYSKTEAQNRSARIEAQVKNSKSQAEVFVYMPDKSSGPPFAVHLDAMMAAQSLNIATVNGYSGQYPKGYGQFYDDYDRCDSFFKWKSASANRYGKGLLDSIMIIGRDDCSDGNHVSKN